MSDVSERIATLRGWEKKPRREHKYGILPEVWSGSEIDPILSAHPWDENSLSDGLIYVSAFDPEHDWSQCGVLLEEQFKQDGDLVFRLLYDMTANMDLKEAICKAWIAMKEAESED